MPRKSFFLCPFVCCILALTFAVAVSAQDAAPSLGVADEADGVPQTEPRSPNARDSMVDARENQIPPPAETTAHVNAQIESAQSTTPAPRETAPQEDAFESFFQPGKGLSFRSQDRQASLEMRLRIQFLDSLTLSSATGEDGTLATDVENTFGIRRARLQFTGHVFGKHNKYKAEFAFSPRDLGIKDGVLTRSPLLSWYAEFTHLRDLSLRLGQYKLLYSRQRVISSGNLAFVDRSLAQGEFNLDRDIGFHLFAKDLFGLDLFRYYAGVSIGEGRDVWTSQTLTGASPDGLQYLARVEFLPLGGAKSSWDYSEVDFERSATPRLSIGLGYAFLDEGTQVRGYQGSKFSDLGTVDYHNLTTDVFLKWAGWTLFLEGFWREGTRGTNTEASSIDLPRNGLGYTAQLDYLLPHADIDVGARYSGIHPGLVDESVTNLEARQEIGVMAGWFIAEHALKVQADYFHIWDADRVTGAEDRIRLQLQFAY